MERESFVKTYVLCTAEKEKCSNCLHGEYENDDIYNCHIMKSYNVENQVVMENQVCNLYESLNRRQNNRRN